MREIKFRAWVTEDPELPEMITENTNTEYQMIGNETWFSVISNHEYYLNESDYIIMQYTWLKDKNGKEIYEGDFVKAHYFNNGGETDKYITGTVEKRCGSWAVVDYTQKDNWLYFHETSAYDFILRNETGENTQTESFEILGNIYENPELLES